MIVFQNGKIFKMKIKIVSFFKMKKIKRENKTLSLIKILNYFSSPVFNIPYISYDVHIKIRFMAY